MKLSALLIVASFGLAQAKKAKLYRVNEKENRKNGTTKRKNDVDFFKESDKLAAEWEGYMRKLQDADMSMSMSLGVPLGGCQDAYAYCGEISSCFIDVEERRLDRRNDRSGPTWGWSTNLADVSFPLVCDLYANAIDCDLETGTLVGQVTIDTDQVSYDLSSAYGASSFSLYGGACEANVVTVQIANGNCPDFITRYASLTTRYPLVTTDDIASVDSLQSSFDFTADNQSGLLTVAWANYDLFPLDGTASRQYVSAYASVCDA